MPEPAPPERLRLPLQGRQLPLRVPVALGRRLAEPQSCHLPVRCRGPAQGPPDFGQKTVVRRGDPALQIHAAQSALGHGVAIVRAPAKPDCCQFFVSEFSCTRSIHLPHSILRLRQTLIRRLAKQRCGLFFIFGHTLPQGMHQGEIVLCRGVIVRSDRLAIPFDSLLLVFGYATSPGVQGAQLGLCRDAANRASRPTPRPSS